MQAVTLQRQLREALQRGDHQAAIVFLDRAVELAREAGDQATEGRYLGNLALLYHRMGYVDDAMRCFQQALERVRAEDDPMTESGLLGNMGNVLREVGQCEQATAYLNEALRIAKTIGDVRGRGIWLSNLGLVYDDLGQSEQAVEYHSQSIVVARQLQDQRGLATRLRKLSDSFLATGNVLEALKCLGEALTIYTAIGDQQELLGGLIASGNIHRILADGATTPAETRLYARNALEYYQHALMLARTESNPTAEREIMMLMKSLALPHPQPLSTSGEGSRTK